jgi:hypothetical protein
VVSVSSLCGTLVMGGTFRFGEGQRHAGFAVFAPAPTDGDEE